MIHKRLYKLFAVTTSAALFESLSELTTTQALLAQTVSIDHVTSLLEYASRYIVFDDKHDAAYSATVYSDKDAARYAYYELAETNAALEVLRLTSYLDHESCVCYRDYDAAYEHVFLSHDEESNVFDIETKRTLVRFFVESDTVTVYDFDKQAQMYTTQISTVEELASLIRESFDSIMSDRLY